MPLIQKTELTKNELKSERREEASSSYVIPTTLNTNNKSYGEYVASKTDLSPDEAIYYTNVIFSAIMDAVREDKIVAVHGFGTFKKVTQKALTIFHQPTQSYIEVPMKEKPHFRAHDNFKNYVNRKDKSL